MRNFSRRVAERLIGTLSPRPTRALTDAKGFEPIVIIARSLLCALLVEFEPLTIATDLFITTSTKQCRWKVLIGAPGWYRTTL